MRRDEWKANKGGAGVGRDMRGREGQGWGGRMLSA